MNCILVTWFDNNQHNQIAVNNIGKAKNSLKVFNQGPDLGISRVAPGIVASKINGIASPMPSMRMVINKMVGGWVKANPKAGAINGAVHGVATSVINSPVKKLSK